MTNIYNGKPDGRQGDEQTRTSRFRPRYRALSDGEKALHDEIKAKATELEELIEAVKDGQPGRYKALAITNLEVAVMWAVKELTA